MTVSFVVWMWDLFLSSVFPVHGSSLSLVSSTSSLYSAVTMTTFSKLLDFFQRSYMAKL